MLLPGSCWKRPSICSPIWMWVTAVVMLTGTTVDAYESLHPNSFECKKETDTTLRCDIRDNTKEYRLDNFKWNNTRKVIIWNASRLVLKNPLCDRHTRTVEIYNSSSVTTEHGEDNCAQRLQLQDCTGVTIEDGANWVQMDSSEADKITLPSLNRFDLKDSLVKELSVAVVHDKSTVTNSTIEVVKKLLINGSVTLTMDDSTLGQVEGITYDSRSTSSMLKNVIVDSVVSNGFLVHSGALTLDSCTISSVASQGLLVVNGADLILRDCEIEEVIYDSIVVTNGGNIYLKNVTVGEEREISLTFLDVSVPLYPLAFLHEPLVSPHAWIAIAVFIGLAVGALVGVGVMMFVMRRRQALGSGVDSMELQTHKQSTGQNAFSPNAYKHMDQPNSTTPSDSSGKMPKADKKQVGNAPPPPPTQRPPRLPVPTPHETSSPPMKDERADLPLPPPPPPPPDDDEELYDEVQDASRQMGNLSALTAHMPKLPHMKKLFP